jgi:hypothetical protein
VLEIKDEPIVENTILKKGTNRWNVPRNGTIAAALLSLETQSYYRYGVQPRQIPGVHIRLQGSTETELRWVNDSKMLLPHDNHTIIPPFPVYNRCVIAPSDNAPPYPDDMLLSNLPPYIEHVYIRRAQCACMTGPDRICPDWHLNNYGLLCYRTRAYLQRIVDRAKDSVITSAPPTRVR